MLPLFPEHALDNSLHTAILLGLLVTWALYETLGWVFAGFVVAGYLAALAIVAPPSLAVVLVESILCYGLVWFLGAGLSRLGVWSRVFGRERFLLFVLVAIPVRLVVTGLSMPRLRDLLVLQGVDAGVFGLGLFGVGVVLVPLTANTFWKVGLGRGVLQLGVTTGITWVIVSQVLVRFTNFGFGDFEHTFDALAVSAWESSRVILVLLCTTFLAARNNLRYGWDFGGILVPALLAVLLFEPSKFVATVAEICLLYTLYEALIRLPRVSELDLEGPRRIVSIYALSYAWKWAVAVVVGALGVRVVVSDAFGFGYLLTSLVVARAHKARSLTRTLVPLLATSLAGAGLALPLAALLARAPLPRSEGSAPSLVTAPLATALPRLASMAGTAARELPRRGDGVPSPQTFSLADGGSCDADLSPLARPEAREPLVVDCHRPGPWILLPRPHADPDAGWLAGWLVDRAQIGGVVLATVDPGRHPTLAATSADVQDQVLAAALRQVPSAPLLVVATRPTAPARLLLRDTTTLTAFQGLLDELGATLDTGAPPEDLAPLWRSLRPSDGVLTLAPEGVPTPPSQPLPWDDVTSLRADLDPEEPDLLVDVVLPALRRAAARPPGQAMPGFVIHLASLVGARAVQVNSPTGPQWLLVRRVDDAMAEERWLFRPGGGDWTVLAGQGWRWEGLGDLAIHHHEALRAAVTWIGAHPPATGERWRQEAGTARSRLDRAVRALLEPTEGWRRDGAPHPEGRALVIEPSPGQARTILLSHGNELVDQVVLEDLLTELAPALGPWPGTRGVRSDLLETSWQASLAYASTYQEAIAPDRIAMLWVPADLLREGMHTEDRASVRAWLLAQGVAVRDEADPGDALSALVQGDPVRAPELEDRLAALATTPTSAELSAFRALPGADVMVWETSPRRLWIGTRQGIVCTRVAGEGDALAWPWQGCWRRR